MRINFEKFKPVCRGLTASFYKLRTGHAQHRILPNKSSLSLIVVLFFILVTLTLHYFLSQNLTVEDSQQLLLPVVVVSLFFISSYFNFGIPQTALVLTLVFWLGLLVRVEFMKKFSFFEGRVVIGRFNDDQLGFEGRRLYKSLQTIAKTYHLPGPSLLPITKRYKDNKTGYLDFGTSNLPALIIYGTKGVYELNFPPVNHSGLINCDLEGFSNSECLKDFPRNTQMLRLSENAATNLAIPSYPLNLKISREPKFVIEHYLEWISAYFSPLINDSTVARLDVLYEAATLEGLSGISNERLLSKFLISYEQVCSWSFDKSSYNIVDARRRLFDVKDRLKFNKNYELYAAVLNLLAVTEILIPSSEDGLSAAEDILVELLNSKKTSPAQKSIATYNLAVVQSFK